MQLKPTLQRYVCLFAVFCGLGTSVLFAADNAADSVQREKELIAVLRSDAPAAEKALACKHLAVHGSSAAVADLAGLLSNEQLASWARIPLEAIPGPAADEALSKALDTLNGNLLVGVINSIGVRRDAAAVGALAARLKHDNNEVASASAVALGRIGDDAASSALRAALKSTDVKVRSAVAEGCVLCAEQRLQGGRQAEAAEIYDEVRKTDLPKQRILEATRGAILARGQGGVELLVEQLHSSDKAMFQIALGTAREMTGDQIDKALADELSKAKPERAALLIAAMADRKETVQLPAVLKAAAGGEKSVRIAAIQALGRVGNASCLAALLETATQDDADLAEAAKIALTELPGDTVNQEIVARLAKPDGKSYPVLLQLVGSRRVAAESALIKALDHADKNVRTAALTSLGATVTADKLPVLIGQVVSPKNAADALTAQKALKEACVRMPDRDACADLLSAAMAKAPAATKPVVLEILGAVGGGNALKSIAASAKSNDPQLQDTGSRLLGEWMTIDAAPVLLDLAKTAPGEKYQVRALRGYLRIARQFVMPDAQRAEMCDKALDAARSSTEQKMVVEILKRYPSVDTLKVAVKAAQIQEVKEEAVQAATVIAQKIGTKSDAVRELIEKIGAAKVKLEIVKAEYGSGSTLKDVTAIVKKNAGDSLLIALDSPSFNTSFGDPTPGVTKQLKIQFKVNGKSGEAAFNENELILLPMPK